MFAAGRMKIFLVIRISGNKSIIFFSLITQIQRNIANNLRKPRSYHEDYRFLMYKPLNNSSSKKIPNVPIYVATSCIWIKGKRIWSVNDNRKGSSILSVICLNIISSLLKAVFQSSGMIQHCFNKALQH